MNSPLSVIVSRGNSHNPTKQQLEQDIAAQLSADRRLRVTVIPHLNDLRPEGRVAQELRSLEGDVVVLSWLYRRAAHWILDTLGVQGRMGAMDEVTEREARNDEADNSSECVLDVHLLPQRRIDYLDLRSIGSAEECVEAVRQIATGDLVSAESPAGRNGDEAQIVELAEAAKRRWYPVIDFSRCTNCMECIDFCLFGVYGVDEADTILVEQPDNCRKGCPACSRVCPENAIIFPQHGTPVIAGAAAHAAHLKLDLSHLFGAPDEGSLPRQLADQERAHHLQEADQHRDSAPEPSPPRDDLDQLIDALDELDL